MTFKQSRVRARRIKKVVEAILTNPPDDMEVRKEMEADYESIDIRLRNYVLAKLGDNHAIDFGAWIDEFEELEVKYIKAPKIALKNL